jgi:hypothetical protein
MDNAGTSRVQHKQRASHIDRRNTPMDEPIIQIDRVNRPEIRFQPPTVREVSDRLIRQTGGERNTCYYSVWPYNTRFFRAPERWNEISVLISARGPLIGKSACSHTEESIRKAVLLTVTDLMIYLLLRESPQIEPRVIDAISQVYKAVRIVANEQGKLLIVSAPGFPHIGRHARLSISEGEKRY